MEIYLHSHFTATFLVPAIPSQAGNGGPEDEFPSWPSAPAINPGNHSDGAGWETLFETLPFAVEHSVSESLALIRQPVLLMGGASDPIIPQSWMETAVPLLSSADPVVSVASIDVSGTFRDGPVRSARF